MVRTGWHRSCRVVRKARPIADESMWQTDVKWSFHDLFVKVKWLSQAVMEPDLGKAESVPRSRTERSPVSMRKILTAAGSAPPMPRYPAFPPLKTRKMSRVLDYSAAPSYLDSIGCKLYWSQGLTAVSSFSEAGGPFWCDCRAAAGGPPYCWPQSESDKDNEHEGWATFYEARPTASPIYFPEMRLGFRRRR